MSETPEFIELLEDAQGALFDLIKSCEPGTGLPLHHAYNHIKSALERAGKRAVAEAPDPAKEERNRRDAEYRARKEAWRTMPWHERERLLLDVLGDKRLSKGEIARAMDESREDLTLYESQISNLLTRMLAAGEIKRERECFGKTGTRWRWSYMRNAKLTGEIADLNRALED
jgi:hypothetical protein